MNADATGAESWIVAGQDGPPEDPRISNLFGPVQETAEGVEIAVLRIRPGRAAPVPLGVLRVAGGRVAFYPAPIPGRQAARRVLVFWTLVWIVWLWRRVRAYE
jgi:hypothetical protein